MSFHNGSCPIEPTLKPFLFSWIGDADLLAWAEATGGKLAERVHAATRKSKPVAPGPGPIKTLTEQCAFDRVHLLSDKDPELARGFASWVGPQCKAHVVTIASPVDYPSIFEAADRVLASVLGGSDPKPPVCIHLSPGTPAMTSIWVLLGKSRYPATFFQTHAGKVIETPIPFDLAVDYLPTLLHGADTALEAAGIPPTLAVGFGPVIGKSPAMRATVARAQRIAIRDVGVLLLGESGVGKEIFAQAIHAAGHRANKPFFAINCAALPQALLESELFGHTKGAFSGADANREGAFIRADGGTLFLDEVGECDLALQAKLLRVLQPDRKDRSTTRRFRPVGSAKEQSSDVRIIAATNRDLQAEIKAGRFREDLYYRLANFILKIPPLRERTPDIPTLADHLLEQINNDFATTEPGFQPKRLGVATMNFLRVQPWPGNVRQLYNALLQAAIMTDHPDITPKDIAAGLSDTVSFRPIADEPPLGDGFNIKDYLDQIQSNLLARAMRQANGNKTGAAKLLGLPKYQTLAAQLERLKVKWKE